MTETAGLESSHARTSPSATVVSCWSGRASSSLTGPSAVDQNRVGRSGPTPQTGLPASFAR